MGKVWEFFENMDELVYVSDVDSHDLVYMNKKALETYGFRTPQDFVGKKCYEVIQNCSAPCSTCNNNELKEGYFKEWQYYNPVLDKHLMMKDTLIEEDGRCYRVDIALDVSLQEQRRAMLHNYQNLEKMVNEALRVAMQATSPSVTLNILIEYIGNALGGERTYIIEHNDQGRDDNTYEWVASGVSREQENLQNMAPEICANWYRSFSQNSHIMIDDLEKVKEENPLQYEVLKRQNIHTLVVVPLYDEGEVIGFYGVDNPTGASLEYASNMLQIMAHFIVTSIRRRNLIRELQTLSYTDQLTQLGNRHAMEEYVKNIKMRSGIGIVYADVTGLKRVNDTISHEAGDRLLIQASDCLREAFDGYGLFRIGGDEMLVVCENIEEARLLERMEMLKKCLQARTVELAAGAVWDKDGAVGIERLMIEAEKRMYKDKAEYYKRVGIDRRR